METKEILTDSLSEFHKVNKPVSIDIKDVTISFDTPKGVYCAVKNVSLQIKKGEIVSIIGHSGCGKSTLMNTISGMVKPTDGEVYANQKLVKGPGPDSIAVK